MYFFPYSRGETPCRNANAAAVPAAWPSVASVAWTRTVPNAMCVTLWQRPAKKRLGTLTEYSTR